jgi:hypothetical protein
MGNMSAKQKIIKVLKEKRNGLLPSDIVAFSDAKLELTLKEVIETVEREDNLYFDEKYYTYYKEE